MKDSVKLTRNSAAPVAEHRQVKILSPDDYRSRVALKSKLSDSNATHSKLSRIPQIKWKCPPKFALNTSWRVAAGEESEELDIQTRREMTVREAVYPDLTAIPPSPFTSPDVEGECFDDSRTPSILTIPIEELAANMSFGTSATADTRINPQEAAPCPSVSGNLALSKCSTSGPQDQPVSIRDMLCDLGSGDMEVAVAALATVATVMQNKEKIDTDLLIKFLTNPKMVKKLMDGDANGTPPAPDANGSFRLPSSTNPQVHKLANEHSELMSTAIPSNSVPQTENRSIVQPISKVETEIKMLATKQGGTRAGSGPVHTLMPAKHPSPSPRSYSDIPPVINSTNLPGGLPQSHIHQVAQVRQVRPPMPSPLRPCEEMDRRQMTNQDIAGVVPVAPLNPSTSKPNMEAFKKMIHAYGASDADGTKPATPVMVSTSRPPYMEERKQYGCGASTSNFTATGNYHLPSFSPMSTQAPQVDLSYLKSLIKQHGEKHETQEHKLQKYGLPGNHLQGLQPAHNTTSMVTNPKYQKPCIYFNSLKGCRNGNNCLYQHDVSKQWRASREVEVPLAKRTRFSDLSRMI